MQKYPLRMSKFQCACEKLLWIICQFALQQMNLDLTPEGEKTINPVAQLYSVYPSLMLFQWNVIWIPGTFHELQGIPGYSRINLFSDDVARPFYLFFAYYCLDIYAEFPQHHLSIAWYDKLSARVFPPYCHQWVWLT